MEFEEALKRVTDMTREVRRRENLACLPAEMREEARADRVAIEIICEWAMKAYDKDKKLGTEMLNVLHV